MHLMSFYATPYSSRHKGEQPAKKLHLIRGLWFGLGVATSLAAVQLLDKGIMADNVNTIDSSSLTSLATTPEASVESLINQSVIDDATVADATTASATVANAPLAGVAEMQPPVQPEITWPRTVEVTVNSGDTLIDILVREGVDHVAAHRLAKDVNRTYNLRRLRPGDKMTLVLEKDSSREVVDALHPASLKQLTMYVSKLETVVVKALGKDHYSIRIEKKKLMTEPSRVRGVITSSLYTTIAEQGVTDREMIGKIIKNFSYDIDFQRDIKRGDVIDIMYETKKTPEGEVVSNGDLLYAKLKSKGREYTQYRYVNELGLPAYYNEKGESIIKSFLRTPIDGARISSGYGMRRHPILGFSKMHAGVDFAAPTGTPIFAAGDGVVVQAGYQGSYGKIVVIKHNNTYSTAYAHASRIPPGIRPGVRVRQGQTVAYVGTTGRSTGPHLHYEIRQYGRQVNPLGVKFAGTDTLTGRRLAGFKEHVRKVHSQLAKLKVDGADQETVALAE